MFDMETAVICGPSGVYTFKVIQQRRSLCFIQCNPINADASWLPAPLNLNSETLTTFWPWLVTLWPWKKSSPCTSCTYYGQLFFVNLSFLKLFCSYETCAVSGTCHLRHKRVNRPNFSISQLSCSEALVVRRTKACDMAQWHTYQSATGLTLIGQAERQTEKIHCRVLFFYIYSQFMYSNWYSCLHFPNTTTLSLIAVTYSRLFHHCHLVPRYRTCWKTK